MDFQSRSDPTFMFHTFGWLQLQQSYFLLEQDMQLWGYVQNKLNCYRPATTFTFTIYIHTWVHMCYAMMGWGEDLFYTSASLLPFLIDICLFHAPNFSLQNWRCYFCFSVCWLLRVPKGMVSVEKNDDEQTPPLYFSNHFLLVLNLINILMLNIHIASVTSFQKK